MSPSRREKHLAKAILSIYPFLFATACIARAAEDKTQSARRNVQSVCAHYKFIIQRASHTQTQSRSHTLEQKKPAQNLHCGASHHPYQLFISVLSSPATKSQSKWRLEAHGWRWSLFLEPRIIAFRQMPQFQLCECTGWEPAFARHIVFVLGLRDAFAYSLHWCVVQSRCEKANLVRRAALAAALSRRGCRARRPPVMLLYLLNNACKHSGNAFSSRSIVVISHVGSLPPFAFSSSAAVAGRPGGSGSGRV